MKILYVAPENVSGGFRLFAKGHAEKGNSARWITFFRNHYGFDEDLCFELKMMSDLSWVKQLRQFRAMLTGKAETSDLEGNPPFWSAGSPLSSFWFQLRDTVNDPVIRRAIQQHDLNGYDIYHFEQGVDPYRDSRWVSSLAGMGKKIVAFYHGSDIRNRGVIRRVLEATGLNLTSEIDLLDRLPGTRYLFLPIDTDTLTPSPRPPDGRIRICHAARNRWFKGSDIIESVVLELATRYPIDWIMIENQPNVVALEAKRASDIYIDQITDLGGWGYGVSSIEALALGIPTVTLINERVKRFIPDHPFVTADRQTLKSVLIGLVENRQELSVLGDTGRDWVVKRHSITSVTDCLYNYYAEAGMI